MADYSYLEGKELKSTRFKVKKKKLIQFAKSIGVKQKQFTDPDDPIAHPAYANAYVFPALMSMTDAKDPDGKPLIKDPLKILHGGQVYRFPKGAPSIKAGDKLVTTPKVKSVEVKSNGMMLISCEAETVKKGTTDVVCNSEIGVVVMPGGF
jgi:hypothetical protein